MQVQSDFAEAESLYLRSLQIKNPNWALNHPEVAMNLHNLAALYSEQGRSRRRRTLAAGA